MVGSHTGTAPLLATDASRPLVIGHRGASAHAPENTRPAFELACRAGAAMLETDARITADGAVVLLHDATLARTTDHEGEMSQLTLADVQAADAGYRFQHRDGTFPWRGREVKVPTLAETLAWLADAWPHVRLNVEIKHAPEQDATAVVAAVAAVIAQAPPSMANHVLLSSFSRSVLLALHRLHPAQPAALICDHDADFQECIEWAIAHGLVGLHPHHALLDGAAQGSGAVAELHRAQTRENRVQRARGAGLAVHVWTVNAPARMLELARVGAGVSGIMTDDPDLLRRTLER